MGVNKKIKKAMIDKRMTQRQLADALGKPFNTVRNILANDNMQTDTLERFADALNCDVVLMERTTGDIYR